MMIAPKIAYVSIIISSFLIWFYFRRQYQKKLERELKEALEKGFENTIQFYLKQGFRVTVTTQNETHLLKSKEFSYLIALLGLFLFFIGFIVYMLIYLCEKNESVKILIGPDGKVSVSRPEVNRVFGI